MKISKKPFSKIPAGPFLLEGMKFVKLANECIDGCYYVNAKIVPFCNLKGGDKFRWNNRTCIKLSADSKLGNAICVESYLQGNTYCISSFDSVEKL